MVGTFVGFPRHKRVVDGYARCLLCKVDLSIAGRGLSSLWEHWRGVEHTRVEQKFRIMMQMPLLDKACRPVSAEEDRRIRRARMSEPPVFLESELSLSVDERVAIEEAEAVAGGKPVLGEESVSFLWLSQFVSSFCSTTTFRDVMQMVESWRDTMNTELIARGKGASVSIRRHEADWLCECHVVCGYAVKTIVLGVVVGGTGWEKRMLDTVVPVLLSLSYASSMRAYSTESDTRIGYALAASVGIVDPLVVGRVTQVWLFDLVRKHFLAEFVGLDPLSVLDYLRVRLASVVQESVLDRLPHLKQVSILNYTCIVCCISKDI